MDQDLYAFWKYDGPPYYLGSEVMAVTTNGLVRVRGYGQAVFKPVLIVPIENGKAMKKKIDDLSDEFKEKVNVLREEHVKELSKLMKIKG